MNIAVSHPHWHLLVNHFPVILSITASLFLVSALIFRKSHMKYAGLLLILFSLPMAFAAQWSGDHAEDPVEELSGVSHDAIEKHEDLGGKAVTLSAVAAALALVTLILLNARKRAANLFLILTVCACLFMAGVMAYVGYTGGAIRHTEIRGDFK